jgi:hypothetical protein
MIGQKCRVTITETPQLSGEFMIINVLGKFSRPQQFVILQCLPPLLHQIKGCVEDDTIRVDEPGSLTIR